jgi:D-methionine transport system ATP-binding protein
MDHSVIQFLERAPVPADATPVVRLRELSRSFGPVQALDRVSLSVHQGEILGLIGRSGAGKSTLIRCLNGLERPDGGTVEIEGRDITAQGERALQPLRRRIGMVFQHFNLLAAQTVADNVGLPLKIEGRSRLQRRKRVSELLELTGLSDKADNYPAQLSGGQKQRVGIARALAAHPALLLCDEATSALDPLTTQSILDLLQDINRQLGLTILLITHEMDVVRKIADRVAILEAGRIVEEGPVWQIFSAPRSASTISLLQGLRPSLPAHLQAALSNTLAAFSVLRLEVAGAQARLPLLAELALETRLTATLLHGGIEHIHGEPVGTLFLALPTADHLAQRRALEFLRTRVGKLEVLGYVASHD